ncbi:tetratricopeptide repeat protein [Gracilinema caldarium]|nr:hypothetical protein [Gracilinema caldarium]
MAFSEDLSLISIKELPTDTEFTKDFTTLQALSGYVDHYEFQWDYPLSKETIEKQLLIIAAHIDERISQHRSNPELWVLKVIILKYLYNLDSPGVAKQLEAVISEATHDFPMDIRFSWLYGDFLSSAGRSLEAISQFRKIITEKASAQLLPGAFWEDYGKACYLALMPKNAITAFQKAADLYNIPLSSYKIASTAIEQLKKPDINGTFSDTDVWNIIKSGESYYLMSRLFGMRLPIQGTWNVKHFGVNNRTSAAILAPPQIKSKTGKEIGINIVVLINFNDINQETFIKPYLSKGTKQISVQNTPIPITRYEWIDKETYAHMGGAHGYMTFLTLPASPESGLQLEIPQIFVSGSEKSFYKPNEIYDRMDHPVHIGIILDSCEEVYEESKAIYDAILSGAIFD